MHLQFSERVQTLLHFLSHDERIRIDAWLDYLRNWEDNEYVKSRSVVLNVEGQSMYLFRTSTDVYIFYTVDLQSKTVTVIDIAPRETILATGGISTGGS